jgi:hypothetical protein
MITRQSGSVTVTAMELRKRGIMRGTSYGPTGTAGLTKSTHDIEASDWTADGSLYYIVCTHGKGTRNVIIDITQDDTSEQIFPERVNKAPAGDTNSVKIWLAFEPKCTVTII